MTMNKVPLWSSTPPEHPGRYWGRSKVTGAVSLVEVVFNLMPTVKGEDTLLRPRFLYAVDGHISPTPDQWDMWMAVIPPPVPEPAIPVEPAYRKDPVKPYNDVEFNIEVPFGVPSHIAADWKAAAAQADGEYRRRAEVNARQCEESQEEKLLKCGDACEDPGLPCGLQLMQPRKTAGEDTAKVTNGERLHEHELKMSELRRRGVVQQHVNALIKLGVTGQQISFLLTPDATEGVAGFNKTKLRGDAATPVPSPYSSCSPVPSPSFPAETVTEKLDLAQQISDLRAIVLRFADRAGVAMYDAERDILSAHVGRKG